MPRDSTDDTPDATLALEPADAADLDRVEALLEANDLPTADVRAGTGRFYLAYTDDGFVGIGGLEVHGTVGLLRSVVVASGARGEGHGADLCAALQARARSAGVESLYLLTATAAGFFRHCGFQEVSRASVPPAVAQTEEFRSLCPDDATCMRTEL